MFGPSSAHKKRICWAEIDPTQPFLKLNLAQLVGPNQPIFYINIIFNIIYIKKQKFSKEPFQKFMMFLQFFLPILFNIRLYFYTVKYKSSFKILGFLWNISKNNFFKNLKTFKLISVFKRKKKKQKNVLFSCIQPSPKMFSSISSWQKNKKKMNLYHVLKCKMDIITSLWLSIRI
jgi:hypothetical protein